MISGCTSPPRPLQLSFIKDFPLHENSVFYEADRTSPPCSAGFSSIKTSFLEYSYCLPMVRTEIPGSWSQMLKKEPEADICFSREERKAQRLLALMSLGDPLPATSPSRWGSSWTSNKTLSSDSRIQDRREDDSSLQNFSVHIFSF